MTAGSIQAFRIPVSLRHDVEQIFTLTDPFCAEYLDTEYGELVRKLIAKLARTVARRPRRSRGRPFRTIHAEDRR